jgi:hypothetical protein
VQLLPDDNSNNPDLLASASSAWLDVVDDDEEDKKKILWLISYLKAIKFNYLTSGLDGSLQHAFTLTEVRAKMECQVMHME